MTDRARVFIVIQTCPGREAALADTLASMAQSDIGEPDAVLVHPAGASIQEHFLSTLRAIAASGREYGIRFEDDVLVNRHIVHNALRWPALDRADFGAGWLFGSGFMHAQLRDVHEDAPELPAPWPDVCGSLGVLVRVADVAELVSDVPENWPPADGQQDRALSRAVWWLDRRVYVHSPSLVEHNARHRSTLAPDRVHAVGVHDSGGRWSETWRRAS